MKKKVIIGIVILVVLLSAVFMLTSGKKALKVDLSPVEKGSVEKVIEEKAEVYLSDQREMYTEIPGSVETVNVTVGDPVKKGDILVAFDEEGIDLQIKGLEASIQTVNAQFAEAKSPSKTSELVKLQSLVKSAQLAYDEAKRQAEGSKTLYDSGAISQDAYETAITNEAAKNAALQSARSNLSVARGEISDNVSLQYISQQESLESQLDLLKKQKEALVIRAPYDGIVLTLKAKEGSYMMPGALILSIGNVAHTYLSADILVEEINGVVVGTKVYIENDDLGLMDEMGKVQKMFPIAFDKLSELGIVQKRVTVEIELDREIPVLKPGYEVTVRLVVDEKPDAVMVNKKAVFDYQGKDHVFVNFNGTAALQLIVTGIETEDVFEVLEGLELGDEVILSPDEGIQEGAKIK